MNEWVNWKCMQQWIFHFSISKLKCLLHNGRFSRLAISNWMRRILANSHAIWMTCLPFLRMPSAQYCAEKNFGAFGILRETEWLENVSHAQGNSQEWSTRRQYVAVLLPFTLLSESSLLSQFHFVSFIKFHKFMKLSIQRFLTHHWVFGMKRRNMVCNCERIFKVQKTYHKSIRKTDINLLLC